MDKALLEKEALQPLRAVEATLDRLVSRIQEGEVTGADLYDISKDLEIISLRVSSVLDVLAPNPPLQPVEGFQLGEATLEVYPSEGPNGVYAVSEVGGAAAPAVLTRLPTPVEQGPADE